MPNPWPEPNDFDEKKLDDFIAAMAKCWVETNKGAALWLLDHDGDWKEIQPQIKGKKATVEEVTGQLHHNFDHDTSGFPRAKRADLVKAWMIARVEEYQFHAAGWRRFGNAWPTFKVVKAHERDTAEVPENLKHDKKSLKIAPGLAAFLTDVSSEFGKFGADNYRGHSTGSGHLDQGMSVDVYLKEDSDQLWWEEKKAVDFLTTVEKLAAAKYKGTQWIALYNHFKVAKAINTTAKIGHVRFRGGGGANYHGPDPCKLHIHLEVVVPSDRG